MDMDMILLIISFNMCEYSKYFVLRLVLTIRRRSGATSGRWRGAKGGGANRKLQDSVYFLHEVFFPEKWKKNEKFSSKQTLTKKCS